ncbi:hypothetical protein ACO1LX_20140, partial [Staphylococcus aureus]
DGIEIVIAGDAFGQVRDVAYEVEQNGQDCREQPLVGAVFGGDENDREPERVGVDGLETVAMA